jgi:hypothetical protein
MKKNTQSGTYIRICKLTKEYKQNQSNTKKYDKRNSHTSSKLHMIYISSNNVRHPVTKTFTTLHYTSPATLYSNSLRYTFHLYGFLATRTSTYVPIRGRSPLHPHYPRTVLRKKKTLPCNAVFLCVTAIFFGLR